MIQGKNISLRAAKAEEIENIFDMALKSGMASFSFSYKTGLESFKKIYHEKYFDKKVSSWGSMMICRKNIPVGFISFCQSGDNKDSATSGIRELAIWMDGEDHCGRGLGSDAINTLSDYLNKTYKISTLFICLTLYNVRAIKAFEKAGFIRQKDREKHEFLLKIFKPKSLSAMDPYNRYISAGFTLLLKNMP